MSSTGKYATYLDELKEYERNVKSARKFKWTRVGHNLHATVDPTEKLSLIISIASYSVYSLSLVKYIPRKDTAPEVHYLKTNIALISEDDDNAIKEAEGWWEHYEPMMEDESPYVNPLEEANRQAKEELKTLTDRADPPTEEKPFTAPCGSFQHKLRDLINRHSIENGSNTPDFILAQYLKNCLDNFDMCTRRRDEWYGLDSNKILETGE